MKELYKRKGVITISKEFIENGDNRALSLLFSNFYPLSIDRTMVEWNGQIIYLGISQHFDIEKENKEECVNHKSYDCIINEIDGGLSIKFKKQ